MIPFKTFLILLTVLVAVSGCSQNPPPGSIQPEKPNANQNNQNAGKADSNNANGSTSGTSGSTGGNSGSGSATGSTAQVEPVNAATEMTATAVDGASMYWDITLKGEGAKVLFGALPVDAVVASKTKQTKAMQTKTVRQIRCEKLNDTTQDRFECTVRVTQAEGVAQDLIAAGDVIKTTENDFKGKQYQAKPDHLFVSAEKDFFANLNVLGQDAKMLFEGLVQGVQAEYPEKTNEDGSKKAAATQKAGKHLDCWKTQSLEAGKDPLYNCKLYLSMTDLQVVLAYQNRNASAASTTTAQK